MNWINLEDIPQEVVLGDWINVKDKTPEGDILAVIRQPVHTPYLFKKTAVAVVHPYEYWRTFGDTIQTFFDADGEDACYGEITYWMPLPEPPEEDRE